MGVSFNSYLTNDKTMQYWLNNLWLCRKLFSGFVAWFIIKPLTIDWSHKSSNKDHDFFRVWEFWWNGRFVSRWILYIFSFAIILGMVLGVPLHIHDFVCEFFFIFRLKQVSDNQRDLFKKSKPGVARWWVLKNNNKKKIFNFNLDFKNKDN